MLVLTEGFANQLSVDFSRIISTNDRTVIVSFHLALPEERGGENLTNRIKQEYWGTLQGNINSKSLIITPLH